jgi:hypothetical protein
MPVRPVVVVAELFQCWCLEPVRLVDDQQLGTRPAALAQGSEVLRGLEFPLDAPAQPVMQEGDLLIDEARAVADLGRIDDRAARHRLLRHGHDVQGPEGLQVRPYDVPSGVLPGRQGLADPGRPVAQADVTVAADRVGELGEPAVLFGDHERTRRGCCGTRFMGGRRVVPRGRLRVLHGLLRPVELEP